MKVVVAEKPSVARDIAAVLGANVKKDGYFEGNDFAVTYALGHLVTIAEPVDMNVAWGSPWSLDQLPMIPDEWKYRITDKGGTQFRVIKNLFADPATTSIICATDAGREGEHIFRLIYQLSGSSKPVERLWISSLTAESIREGFNKLKPSTAFDDLANAAKSRAHADWVVGLNFTRAYTTINRQLCTIGRVQTPTLALIVERQKLIDSFKSQNFFEVLASFEPGFGAKYITPGAEAQTRIQDKAVAEAIVQDVKKHKTGLVKSITNLEKRNKAPALYDLLTLQKEANKRFGYTAQETLDIAQSLYEEYKLISYPRTESRHLSTDMIDQLPGILISVLRGALSTKEIKEAFKNINLIPSTITGDELRKRLSKAYVDDAKLTDHHAIIPTDKALTSNLPERQLNVYQLIATRFLSIFLPPEVRDETTIIIGIGEHSFRARGVVIRELGWTVVEPKSKDKEATSADGAEAAGAKPKKSKAKDKDKDKDNEEQQLPPLTKDEEIVKRGEELKEGKTSAPKPYDDASLLTAMKNAGQELDDEDLASYMKQSGLGTPATRAAIIERLLQTGYIERNKKYVLPTEKGVSLIENVHGKLKDVGLTATWEQQLKDMQDGKLTPDHFENAIGGFVRELLPDVIEKTDRLPDSVKAEDLGRCPQCQKGAVRMTPKGAGCSRWMDGCKFTIWNELAGKKLSDSLIKELFENRKSKLIKGFKKKDGSGTFDAKLVIGDDFKVKLEFPQSDDDQGIGPCPKCKDGILRTTPKGIGCNRWREGCNFSIWRETYGKTLSDGQMKELAQNGRTKLIKGFQKKDGSGSYDACLMLSVEFKVQVDFSAPKEEDLAAADETESASGTEDAGKKTKAVAKDVPAKVKRSKASETTEAPLPV